MKKRYKLLKDQPTQRKLLLKNAVVRVGGLLLLLSCGDSPLPKPSSYMRLDYPNAEYKVLETKSPYQFEHAGRAVIIPKKKRLGRSLLSRYEGNPRFDLSAGKRKFKGFVCRCGKTDL
jgi:hypothetical protein